MLGTLQRSWGALYTADTGRSAEESCETKSNPLLVSRLADESKRAPSRVCERGPTAAIDELAMAELPNVDVISHPPPARDYIHTANERTTSGCCRVHLQYICTSPASDLPRGLSLSFFAGPTCVSFMAGNLVYFATYLPTFRSYPTQIVCSLMIAIPESFPIG